MTFSVNLTNLFIEFPRHMILLYTTMMSFGIFSELLYFSKPCVGNVRKSSRRGGVLVTRDDHQHGDNNLKQHDYDVQDVRLVINTGQESKATCTY